MADGYGITVLDEDKKIKMWEQYAAQQNAAKAAKQPEEKKTFGPSQADSPLAGMTTQESAARQREMVAQVRKEQEAKYAANPTEDPKNQAGAMALAKQNRETLLNFTYYKLDPEKLQEQKKPAIA